MQTCLGLDSDGAGLFAGVLKHLLSRGSDCPKVITTTHFHELFTIGALEPQTLPITFVHMEIMFATRGGEVIDGASASSTVTKSENITYLYRLVSCYSAPQHTY
jgi:DNA mismatch repair protein MSH5